MTGVDWPGKSAIHSGCPGSAESGRPVSSEVPFCCGPRQLSQPVAAAREETGAASRRPDRQNAVGIFSFIARLWKQGRSAISLRPPNLLPRVVLLFYI